MNRSFAKENTPPNIMIPKSTTGLSKQIQYIQNSSSKKSSKGIRSKTPPDLHYNQASFQSAGMPFSGKHHVNNTAYFEDNTNITANNLSSNLTQITVPEETQACSSKMGNNGCKPTIIAPKLHKQQLSSDVAKKHRELLGYLNIAAQENVENLKRIVKLGTNDNMNVSGNINSCDNIRESVVDSNSSRRRVINSKRAENDKEAANPLRYSLENYGGGETEKQILISRIIKNNPGFQNSVSRSKVPSSTETVKLLMQMKNNDSANNLMRDGVPRSEEVEQISKPPSKSKENLRHSLENTMWILQKHQKNLSAADQQRGAGNLSRKTAQKEFPNAAVNSSGVVHKVGENCEDAGTHIDYYMSYPQQQVKLLRESLGGGNCESLSQMMQKANGEEPSIIAPSSRKHSTENSKVRHSCEGVFNNKQGRNNLGAALLQNMEENREKQGLLAEHAPCEDFEGNEVDYAGRARPTGNAASGKQTSNLKKEEVYSNRINENIIKKMLSKDEVDNLRDENKNLMTNLKKANIELEQTKHVNSQLEKEIHEFRKQAEAERDLIQSENKQLKSKVMELQKYHDFLINEKKKVMKFENEIIIKDSQLGDYKLMFK